MDYKNPRKEPYDDFAGLYSRHWPSSAYYRQAASILDRLLFSRLPRGSALLDLCCGTGCMSALAAQRGFAVTGLDISGEMLRYARETMPASPFLHCDARSFCLPALFKGVFSTFESMSHILSAGDLMAIFKNACLALDQGGIFIFDLLTERAYQELWNGSSVIDDGGRECIISGVYEPATKTAWADIAVMRTETGRHEPVTRIFEKCHDIREVADALALAGFEGIETLSAAGELGMTGPLGIGRVFVRAVKPLLLGGPAEMNTTGGRAA